DLSPLFPNTGRSLCAEVTDSERISFRRLRIIVIFIMPPNPVWAFVALVAALGHQVEILIINVHHVDATRVGRIGVEYGAGPVLVEHTYSLALRDPWVLLHEVVERLLIGQFLRRE